MFFFSFLFEISIRTFCDSVTEVANTFKEFFAAGFFIKEHGNIPLSAWIIDLLPTSPQDLYILYLLFIDR
nr:MAG TPA: hypothetical protein [Caudoviricetes sp.]